MFKHFGTEYNSVPAIKILQLRRRFWVAPRTETFEMTT
jgi:hypothetical protein